MAVPMYNVCVMCAVWNSAKCALMQVAAVECPLTPQNASIALETCSRIKIQTCINNNEIKLEGI